MDIFGWKAKAVLRQMGRDAAIRHITTMQAFISLNAVSDCPSTFDFPLSTVLRENFTENYGAEWKHPAFVKGFVHSLGQWTPDNAYLKKVRDVHASVSLSKNKFLPPALLHYDLVIRQGKRVALPPPTRDNVVYLSARAVS